MRSHRDGAFQKLSYAATWLDRGNALDFGMIESQLHATFALPMPTREQPLLITPGYNERWIDGPRAPDLPERVVDAYLELLWVPKLTEHWTAIVGVAPGIYSDLEDDVDGADLRITGKGLMKWDFAPERWSLLFGVVYLDRDDISLLPAGGLIWTPHEAARVDILFPNPKAAWRVNYESCCWEDWLYLAGEFGGDQWSVRRGGLDDVMIMRDYRLLLGVERRFDGGAGYRCEIGYVFGRRVEFGSTLSIYQPNDAALVRGGITF